MHTLRSFYNHPKGISWWFSLGLIFFANGICWSSAMLSISVMMISLTILVRFDEQKKCLTWNKTILQELDQVFHQPYLVSFILIFAAFFISGLWSESLKDWYWFCRMLLPCLLLPIAFYIHGALHRDQWYLILYVFAASTFGLSIYVLSDYLQHAESYNLNLLKGKPIIQSISHIRFSMILAILTCICLYAFEQKKYFRFPFESYLALGFAIYFFVFIHFISVKTGLVGLYCGLIYYFYTSYKEKKASRLWIISGALLLAVLAFGLIPSLQNKFYYSIWQIGEWYRGKWILYSDLERFVSWQIGWEMIKHNPFFGSGIGDLYTATKQTYAECFGFEQGKLPHNQFIFNWAFTGIFGVFSLLGLLYYSLLAKNWNANPLVMSIQIILWFSCLFEYTFGTQMGCGLFVMVSLSSWTMMRIKGKL